MLKTLYLISEENLYLVIPGRQCESVKVNLLQSFRVFELTKDNLMMMNEMMNESKIG